LFIWSLKSINGILSTAILKFDEDLNFKCFKLNLLASNWRTEAHRRKREQRGRHARLLRVHWRRRRGLHRRLDRRRERVPALRASPPRAGRDPLPRTTSRRRSSTPICQGGGRRACQEGKKFEAGAAEHQQEASSDFCPV
jgi:hypothetical protein